jgi:hypothetical protein
MALEHKGRMHGCIAVMTTLFRLLINALESIDPITDRLP